MAPYVILVTVEVKPEHTAALLEAIGTNARGTREEAEGVRFDVLRDRANPNTFVFYEVYENDGSAVAAHRASAHYQAWVQFKKKYGVVRQEVCKLDAVDWTSVPSPIILHRSKL